MAKKKRRGHYCKICGEIKANEKFSGKGHAAHICKSCQSASKGKKANLLRHQDITTEISDEKLYLPDEVSLDEKLYHTDEVSSDEKLFHPYEMSEIDFYAIDYMDIDFSPVFPEKKKFTQLFSHEKAFLRDYIRSEIIEYWQLSGKSLNENILIEIRKRMMGVFEEDCNIILKNDKILRKFFHDNATSVINKLQKKIDTNAGT